MKQSIIGREPQVLIVDDDPRYLELLQFALESEGFRVVTALDPRQVQGLAVSCQPDVIISDIAMPEMDGFDVAAGLRTDARTADIPVVFLSARGMESDRFDGLRSGAADYVTKPFSTTELIDKIRSVMKEVP
jgi:two-component system phosphate regulon response regulator PhoB